MHKDNDKWCSLGSSILLLLPEMAAINPIDDASADGAPGTPLGNDATDTLSSAVPREGAFWEPPIPDDAVATDAAAIRIYMT